MKKVQLMLGAILVLSAGPTIAKQCLATLRYFDTDINKQETGFYWLVDCGHAACDLEKNIDYAEAAKFHRSVLTEELELIMTSTLLPDVEKDRAIDEKLEQISETRTNIYLKFCQGFESSEAFELIFGSPGKE